MNESSNLGKICPSCEQVNKANVKFCNNCGASLENIEPVEVESFPSSGSETNKVEIKHYYKKTKIVLNLCCISFLLIIGIFGIWLQSTDTVQGSVMGFILLLFFFPSACCIYCGVLYYTKDMGQLRLFSISDQKILLNLPKKPVFEIQWKDFDSVQMYKDIISVSLFSNVQRNGYKMIFHMKDASTRETMIELGRDFNVRTSKKIRSLIKKYANRLGKDYFWGKTRKI